MDKKNNKKQTTPYHTDAFTYTMHQYNGDTLDRKEVWDNYDNMVEDMLKYDLTNIAKIEMLQVKNEYAVNPARLVRAALEAGVIYIADRVQTLGEFSEQYMIPVCDAMHVDYNAPVVPMLKSGVAAVAHALNPETDVVCDRRLKPIWPVAKSRGRGE